MPESVEVRRDQGLIEIRSWGVVTREDLEATLQSLLKALRESGFSHVLIDGREQLSLPDTVDTFEYGERAAVVLAGRGLRIAAVPSDAAREKASFLENVAFNRGLALRLFPTLEAALSWLLVSQRRAEDPGSPRTNSGASGG
ncbi:MAG TPA: hypothetical protein VF017_21530 [Thermoanaerobaculia bacterium]|nr:hypothetical protein [Thermoanaerobaculia bacterium]